MRFLPLLHAQIIALAVLLTSCDRQKQLLREKEKLEAEYKQATEDIQSIEKRILSLGTEVATASVNLERQVVAAEQKAASLEAEVGVLETKTQALEKAAKEFSLRVDTYKAKHLR
jgi:chromosome segregation ATPase